jgi:hypothetical protein
VTRGQVSISPQRRGRPSRSVETGVSLCLAPRLGCVAASERCIVDDERVHGDGSSGCADSQGSGDAGGTPKARESATLQKN